jgi:carboxylesterase type B
MMSERSRNLFNRAILFSGNALNPWSIPPVADVGWKVARRLGFKGTNDSGVLDFLEKSNMVDIIQARMSILSAEEEYGQFSDIVVGPVIEPAWSPNPFITKPPVLAARTAWSNRIDALFLVNSFEGLFQAYREQSDQINLLVKVFNNNSALFAPLGIFKINAESQRSKAIGQRFKEIYFPNGTVFNNNTLSSFYQVR